jgi:hypothetical protein
MPGTTVRTVRGHAFGANYAFPVGTCRVLTAGVGAVCPWGEASRRWPPRRHPAPPGSRSPQNQCPVAARTDSSMSNSTRQTLSPQRTTRLPMPGACPASPGAKQMPFHYLVERSGIRPVCEAILERVGPMEGLGHTARPDDRGGLQRDRRHLVGPRRRHQQREGVPVPVVRQWRVVQRPSHGLGGEAIGPTGRPSPSPQMVGTCTPPTAPSSPRGRVAA